MAITYSDITRVNAEIKTVKIKTKNYAEVVEKVKAYRKLFPDGSITTELLHLEDGMCVIKATVTDSNGSVLGTGIAYERENASRINMSSFIENCETSAVGRALSFCGIGSDTSIASFEEVANAEKQQEAFEPIDKQRILTIEALCKDVNKPLPDMEGWTKGKGDKAIQRLMEIRSEK